MAIIKVEKGKPVESGVLNDNFKELYDKVNTEVDRMNASVEATKTMVNSSVETILGLKVINGELTSVTDDETTSEIKELVENKSLVKHLLDLRYNRNANCKYVKPLMSESEFEQLREMETSSSGEIDYKNYFQYGATLKKKADVVVSTVKKIKNTNYFYGYKETYGTLSTKDTTLDEYAAKKNVIVEKELNLYIPCGINSSEIYVNNLCQDLEIKLPDGITFDKYSISYNIVNRNTYVPVDKTTLTVPLSFIDFYGIENNSIKAGIKLYAPKFKKPKEDDGTYKTGKFDINVTIRGI